MRLSKLDWLVGFVLPIPLFFVLDGRGIALQTNALSDATLSYPLSFFLLPLATIFGGPQRSDFEVTGAVLYLSFFVIFGILSISLALYSSLLLSEVKPFFYALQWMVSYAWFFYFITLRDLSYLRNFLNGFLWGTLFGTCYTFIAGFLEILIFGGLMDSGRMTQNLILPGQYQLYVYIPTVIAFSSHIVFAAVKFKIIIFSEVKLAFLLIVSFIAIVFTGSREGILVYLLGFVLIMSVVSFGFLVVMLCISSLASILIYLYYFDELNVAFDGLRLLNKVHDLFEAGKGFGDRDSMVVQFFEVIKTSPLLGSAMMPPSEIFGYLGVYAPSAHNYYIDAFAWGGGVYFVVVFLFVAFTVFFCILLVSKAFSAKNRLALFNSSIALCLLLFILVSNNINVPLRQPFPGAIGIFLVYWVFVGCNRYKSVTLNLVGKC